MKTGQLQANATGVQQWIVWAQVFEFIHDIIRMAYHQAKSSKVQKALNMVHLA